MGENRQRPRYRIANTIRCEDLTDQRPFYTVIKDISSSGVKLTSDDCISVDRPIRFKLNLIHSTVEGSGKVVWCSQQPNSSRFQVGVEFTEIRPESRETLESYIGAIESFS